LLARILLRQLVDDKVLALGVVEESGLITLASRSAAQLDLRPDQPWQDMVSGGPTVWWGLRQGSADVDSPPLKKRQQRDFAAAIAKLPAGKAAQIKVRLKLGHAQEDMWLNVVSTQRETYGYTFVAEVQEASKIWPHLQAGERCLVNAWQVRETRLPE
jgi:hypothetical protein